MDRISLGILGEDIAARHLVATGHVIRDRNWRIKGGELDLVAERGGEIVFVEVKTRRGNGYGLPEEAVTWRKRMRLRHAALAYIDRHDLHARAHRIDVMSVTVHQGSRRASLAWFRSAVGEAG